uniref:Major facilitator superfamily (MFS) profile domain-containing protein n=1 Tax=Strigamia maritima TaxID=126957 RepID=T1J8V7_STRMM
MGKSKIFTLKFADDIVTFAVDREGLTEMLLDLERYTQKSSLVLNVQKSKILIFRRGGRRAAAEHWSFGGQQIEVVNKRREEIEIVNGKYMKMILGLNFNTPDYLWAMELGRNDLECVAIKRGFKYVLHILEMNEKRWSLICLKEMMNPNCNPKFIWWADFERMVNNVGSCELVAAMRQNQMLETFINATQVQRNANGLGFSETQVDCVWASVVSVYCLGATVGSLFISYVVERFGIRKSLSVNNVILVIGVAFICLAFYVKSYELMVIGRFVIGVNTGLNAGLAPIYLTEIAPKNIRGATGATYQLTVTIAILLSEGLAHPSLLGTSNNWPYLCALTAIPAILQFIG